MMLRRWRRSSCRRLPVLPGALVAVAGAWAGVVAASAAGHAAWFGHANLATPTWRMVMVALGSWQVMTVAMMGPSCLPFARYVAANTLRPRRTVPVFAGGFLAAWTAFFLAFALADGAAHAILGPGYGGGPEGYLVTGLTLALAAGWQLTGAKRRTLAACRQVGLLPAHGRRADRAAFRLGAGQGAWCLGSCWLMMLATMASAPGSWAIMVLVSVVAWVEKATREGLRLLRPTAALLGACALAFAGAGTGALAARAPAARPGALAGRLPGTSVTTLAGRLAAFASPSGMTSDSPERLLRHAYRPRVLP
jgi:predicted metal-binding membrane protein